MTEKFSDLRSHSKNAKTTHNRYFCAAPVLQMEKTAGRTITQSVNRLNFVQNDGVISPLYWEH